MQYTRNKKIVLILFYIATTYLMTSVLLHIRFPGKAMEIGAYFIICTIISLLIALLLCLNKIRIISSFFAVLTALSFGFLSYICFYFKKINSHLSGPDVDAAMQSNPYETVFYIIENMFTYQGIISFFIVSGLVYLFFISLSKFIKQNITPSKKSYAISILTCLALLTYSIPNAHTISFIYGRMQAWHKSVEEFKHIQEALLAKNVVEKSLKNKGEIYVIVIGESQSRDYMHAFSPYPALENTPWMSEQSKNNSWTFFENSYAFHTHTIENLSVALTDSRAISGLNFPKGETIISLARRYDVKSIWLSNQNKMGRWDSPISALASTADKATFRNDINSFGFHLDDELLPLLDDELAKIKPEQNTLIIIHLLGSHDPYAHRFPKDYNTYDFENTAFIGNLIHKKYKQDFYEYTSINTFTDNVLKNIVNRLEKIQKPVAFMYFSDHGEDVMGERGHNYSSFTWSMARIPFAIWLSPLYQERYPEKLAHLKKNSQEIFTNDLIFDAYAGLLNIDDDVYKEEYDIGSESYSINIENAVLAENKKVKEDFAIRKKLNLLPQNVIAHRSNTLFKTAQANAHGIREFEIDLVYGDFSEAGATLYVGHEAESITMPLSEYLKHCNKFLDFIWFDIKNLDADNKQYVFEIMQQLNSEYNIKNRALIESNAPIHLEQFVNDSWQTSYYLSWKDLLEEKDRAKLDNKFQSIAEEITEHNIHGISYDLKADEIIQKQLKPLLPADTKYYAWRVGGESGWSYSDPDLDEKLAPYAHLSRICIKFNSDFSY